MAEERTRRFQRRPCRGEVLVYRLGGGPAIKGTLIDIGGGARLALDGRLDEGEIIRLVFRRTCDATHHPGRIIIGRVAHSQGTSEPRRHLVGIAFAWHADVREEARPISRKAVSRSWFGFLSRRAGRQGPAVVRRG
jgi:hypothetical protein